ncbi:MAG: ATP-dependent DNA helicase [Candidatus Wallbacteria bacterium]|nr:ATP-dependent DNA helicase [Candidatus Wallbacteria bacterium]
MQTLKRTVKISVRGLVEHVLNRGDLDFSFFGASRMAEGVRAHQKIQKSRPEGYCAEVQVKRRFETPEFTLEISGKIDGVLPGSDKTVIEEIKTTGRELNELERYADLHWAQLKVYAYIYCLEHDLQALEGRVVYLQQDSGEIREMILPLYLPELTDFFDSLFSSYLEWALRISGWQKIRDKALLECPFPYKSYRRGQRRMAVGVFRTVRDGGVLLVEAPTGIGKTMAAIYPSAKALGNGDCDKIFYLTARNTQACAAEKAVLELSLLGVRLKSVTLTAKEKICPLPGTSCNPVDCKFAAGYFDRLSEGLLEIFGQDRFDQAAVLKAAETHSLCPFEFSLDLSLHADLVICDYNYAFHPRVYLRRFFAEENGNYVFLVDEAHNLPDRGREMFSASLFKSDFLAVKKNLKNELNLARRLSSINSIFLKLKKKMHDSVESFKDPPEILIQPLRKFLKAAENRLSDRKRPAGRELLEFYFEVSAFLRILENYDQNYATIMETGGKDLVVKLFCLNPSLLMKESFTRARASVLFSATLSPPDYFLETSGCKGAMVISLPSPFPPENLKLLSADRISTMYKFRDETKEQIAAMIEAAVSGKIGNYFAFFPSYEYLDKIKEIVIRNPGIEIVIQRPGMNDTDRLAFLDRFSAAGKKTLLGLAVMGGIFGEGIDLVGDKLSGAMIAGLGLPGISAERELIREYFQRTTGIGFEIAYLYPGLNRVLQAAGRVIRTESDRGFVLLIDSRYKEVRVRKLLPCHWTLTPVRNTAETCFLLSEFWCNGAGNRVE